MRRKHIRKLNEFAAPNFTGVTFEDNKYIVYINGIRKIDCKTRDEAKIRLENYLKRAEKFSSAKQQNPKIDQSTLIDPNTANTQEMSLQDMWKLAIEGLNCLGTNVAMLKLANNIK